MTAQFIDRKALKAEAKSILADAQVHPKGITALYLLLALALGLLDSLSASAGILGTFVSVLTSLMVMVLSAGFVLYFMAVRRGQRAEYLTLFDGFSFAGKVIALNIIMYLFVALWSMLFAIPGLIAAYRYRFALYNLYENPGIGVMEALDMSKKQTLGYKGQLFMLDLSYIGWIILASLLDAFIFWDDYAALFQGAFSGSIGPVEAAVAMGSTAFLLSLLCSAWSLAVQLFYLPNYQCTELGYFEIAKQTSGIGFAIPQQDPDGLGGMN